MTAYTELPKDHQENESFRGVNFTGISLAKKTFVGCAFHNCNFTESLLCNARFVACTFQACNFSLVKWDGCCLQDAAFEDCKFAGAEFFKCEKRLFSIKLRNSFLQYCNFADLNMKGCSFHGCKLKECYFTETCLVGVDFSEADLVGTLFHKCDLSKANFRDAKGYQIDVRANIVKQARFSFPEAMGLLTGLEVVIE